MPTCAFDKNHRRDLYSLSPPSTQSCYVIHQNVEFQRRHGSRLLSLDIPCLSPPPWPVFQFRRTPTCPEGPLCLQNIENTCREQHTMREMLPRPLVSSHSRIRQRPSSGMLRYISHW